MCESCKFLLKLYNPYGTDDDLMFAEGKIEACALDDRYFELEKIFGKEKATLATNSHMEAIQ